MDWALYISFRTPEGTWGELKNLGSPINSSAKEHCPVVSFDGKYFFFTNYRRSPEFDLARL